MKWLRCVDCGNEFKDTLPTTYYPTACARCGGYNLTSFELGTEAKIEILPMPKQLKEWYGKYGSKGKKD